jgi:hypothetical protein
LREFHGNVWCLRPATWEVPSFDGPLLTELRSAMNDAMADGGTIVQRVLQGQLYGKDLEYGEATLGKIYCDFVRGQRKLNESQWNTPDNAAALGVTEAMVAALHVTIPTEVLDANRAVRPDRLQALYEYVREQKDLAEWLPLPPYSPGANDRLGRIIQLLNDKLGGVQDGSYKFHKQLAIKWIYDTPMSEIIADHIAFRRSRGDRAPVSALIRGLFEDLEQDIRHQLVKYYIAYNSVLRLVLLERGDAATAESMEPFYVYLECGASDRIALSLIALGLSRTTALNLRKEVEFPADATPEECAARLANMNLNKLPIPALCLREVNELLGRSD